MNQIKRQLRIGSGLLLLALLTLTSMAQAAPTWKLQTVVETDIWGIGRGTSLALDSSGTPHISYSATNNLKYATMDDDGSWVIETVESASVGQHTSLALDSSGIPHISYYNKWDQGFKYATLDSNGNWVIETVANYNIDGSDNSLALDSSGNPHISYRSISIRDASLYINLNYATQDSNGNWVIETVANEGYDISLALDSNDTPHISYSDYYNLKYATMDDEGIWGIQTIESTSNVPNVGNVGEYTSLALDSNDTPHISYYYGGESNDLKYATQDSNGMWKVQTVDFEGVVGGDTSLALDSNGNPHISYGDYSKRGLKYATWDGTEWQIQTVDNRDVAQFTSLALDKYDTPHISYYHRYLLGLEYAVLQPDDSDGDGIEDEEDNCVSVSNSDQANFDGDAEGDACDADDDNDGVDDVHDDCPFEDATGLDADNNGCLDRIDQLPAIIEMMNLHHGIERALLSKVSHAEQDLSQGNTAGATEKLLSFINHVEAQRGKKITEVQADLLVAFAQNILAQI